MAKGKIKKTPSRVKYDQKRPIFSFRTYDELNDRMRAVKKAKGISKTKIVEIAVGLLEVKIRSEAEIMEKAFKEGHRKGYELAESIYKVIYPCNVCREDIAVDTEEEKMAIKTYMRDKGWGHAECHKQRQQL